MYVCACVCMHVCVPQHKRPAGEGGRNTLTSREWPCDWPPVKVWSGHLHLSGITKAAGVYSYYYTVDVVIPTFVHVHVHNAIDVHVHVHVYALHVHTCKLCTIIPCI